MRRMARIWSLRFARYLIMGAVNTLFGYGVFYLLLRLTVPPSPALAAATVLGVLFNFVTTGRVVFQNAQTSRLGRFATAYLVVFLFNDALLESAMTFGVTAAAAQAMLLLPCVVLSYALQRAFVFAPEASKA
ncbi:MAG: GtrA family protein [Methylocystis sp.]|uniref:GtrA family protein n=1 Tax=Methylocystis sp. TaxID=1911079 RepID=UPI003DA3AB96